jgi:hypothetical protein
MKITRHTRILLLRIAYWIGIILDTVAFVQMAFPEIGKRMLNVTMELGPEYIFAINLGAGLMLAWTLLLFWADRKPLERRMIIPLTMIIIAWNTCTMIYGVSTQLIPRESMLPQIIISSVLFAYYGFCYFITRQLDRHE